MFKIGQEIVCIARKHQWKIRDKQHLSLFPEKNHVYHCDGYDPKYPGLIFLQEICCICPTTRGRVSFDEKAFKPVQKCDGDAMKEILERFIPSECQPLKVKQPETVEK